MSEAIMEQREDWGFERRTLNRWAIWKMRTDEHTLMHLCGLTWAGSPPSIMAPIYEHGAKKSEDATGYARELPPPPDYTMAQVDEFILALAPIQPVAHAALLARHCRIVNGERMLIRSETWLAQSLYGKSRARSHARLIQDCIIGYEALRRWLAQRCLAA